MFRILRPLAFAVLLLSTSCSSLPSDEVKAIIGAAGGSLAHPSGALLVIPAGALASDVELSIKAQSAPSEADVGAAMVGQAFVLGPEGQQFLSAIELSLPYDPTSLPAGATAQDLRIRISPQARLSFEELPTQVDEAQRLLTAAITHFSIVVPSVSSGISCTSLVNGAPIVAETRVASAAPLPQGGAVVSGTYYRTSSIIYTGSGGASGLTGRTRQQTLRLTMSGNSGTVENVDDNRTGNVVRDTGNLTLSGSSFTLNRSCPAAAAQTLSFTASPTSFSVIETVSEGTRVTTFTLSDQVDAGTPGDGGSCSSLTQLAPLVQETLIAETAPLPSGGALVSGTFVRTADHVYTGATGQSGLTGKQRRHTLKIEASSASSATAEEVYANVSAGTVDVRAYAATATGTSLNFAISCPATSGSITLGYSASADELRLFEQASNGMRVYTFSRLYADGGIPAPYDAGTMPFDAGTADAGAADAGPTIDTLATGLSDLVDLDVGATDVFVLGGGSVKKCALSGCGTSAGLVVNTYASSLAVNGTTLFVTDSFRNVSSCDLSGGSCKLSLFTDVGPNSYPTHLWIANSRVYWMSESGSARYIKTCPLTGCSTGYPKNVFTGAPIDGVALGGLAVDAQNAYVLAYTGGLFRIPLTDAETGNAAAATQLTGTEFGSGGLDLDSSALRFTVIGANKLLGCTVPGCVDLALIKGALSSPGAVRANATHVYGINRGTPNGSGGYVSNTATIWRYAR